MRASTRTLSLVGASCIMAACLETGVAPPVGGPSPEAVRAAQTVRLGVPNQARESLQGDVVLFPVSGTGLALALDGGASAVSHDGYVDQVFVLQQESPTAESPRLLTNADIHYAGSLLLVRAPGHRPLLFLVQGQGDPVPDAGAIGANDAQRYSGFGLARRTGSWEVRLTDVAATPMRDLLPTCAASANADSTASAAGTCDSGGVGSTSCSTSCVSAGEGCATSCGSGYYSCCNKAVCTCTCVRVDTRRM